MTSTSLRPISARDMQHAVSGVGGLPIEQSQQWEEFSAAQGHPLWAGELGRLAWYENDKCIAVIALFEYKLRALRYLWAKSGPVWIREATPEREERLRKDLLKFVRSRDRGIVFIRLHSWFAAKDLEEPLQIVTYDRTVIIETGRGDRDAVLESLTNGGRRTLRRSTKKADEFGVQIHEETEAASVDFSPYYEVLKQTAERDGFRPHPIGYYQSLLRILGSQHARVFTARTQDNEILCWDLVLLNGKNAQAEYGASSDRGRRLGSPAFLDVEVALLLGSEGFKGFDLRGIHSPRNSTLFHVGRYKLAFATSYTDVAGAWDLPVSRPQYIMVRSLLNVKRKLRRVSR